SFRIQELRLNQVRPRNRYLSKSRNIRKTQHSPFNHSGGTLLALSEMRRGHDGTKFMKDEMAFRFTHSNGQQLSCSLQVEPISIGCEAWIDVNRFCATE